MTRSHELVIELMGVKCRCGWKKQPRQTLCSRCYFALPEDMRRALYRRVGEGYEEAYEDAVAFLMGAGRVK